MFYLGRFEDRLSHWAKFRLTLESSDTPFLDVLAYYDKAPRVSINTDPWDQKVWPGPWELINENQYCSFCVMLGMCYTLQLTERFSRANFEIHIAKDNINSSTHYYILVDNDSIIGYEDGKVINKNELPKNVYSQQQYPMPRLQ
jgi:hypothetical protein|tara:strand:+ start:630 stop:1061 length:432 start_codon:yes stop_codon:yes gene_type:complete